MACPSHVYQLCYVLLQVHVSCFLDGKRRAGGRGEEMGQKGGEEEGMGRARGEGTGAGTNRVKKGTEKWVEKRPGKGG